MSELYYLPIRISKTLGWLASSIEIERMLGLSDENQRDDCRALMQTIVENYEGSLVVVSDEQAPYVYVFAKVCKDCGWEELGRTVWSRLFEDEQSVCGEITKPEIEPSEVTYKRLGRTRR